MGIPLVVVAALTGGLLGAGAVLLSVVVTAFAWPLLPRGVGGPLYPRRFSRFPRFPRLIHRQLTPPPSAGTASIHMAR